MKKVKSSYRILSNINAERMLTLIEKAGRTCYKSEDKITRTSSLDFVKMLINKKHFSVLEHVSISVKFIFDRGLSHEIVRHRIASFSQESTRYCNYTKSKFDSQITVIDIANFFTNVKSVAVWRDAMLFAEQSYFKLIANGERPEIARSVLPNSLKTEIVVTTNLREWRLIFSQRTANAAHPQMRALMSCLLYDLQNKIPYIFDDLKVL